MPSWPSSRVRPSSPAGSSKPMARGFFARRQLLQALAAGAVTAPLSRALRADPQAPPPQRLMIFMQNNGTQQANFWPDSSLSSPILDALFLDGAGVDNGLRAKTNLIKGVYVPR